MFLVRKSRLHPEQQYSMPLKSGMMEGGSPQPHLFLFANDGMAPMLNYEVRVGNEIT